MIRRTVAVVAVVVALMVGAIFGYFIGGYNQRPVTVYSTEYSQREITALSTDYLSGAYSAPIAYHAPATWAPIGTCGLWSAFDAPNGSQYEGPHDVPIATVVALTYYGVFNQTSSCPVPNFLTVSITAPDYNSTVRLLLVRTSGNSSVYGASLTFSSNEDGNVDLKLVGLPSGYHDLTQTDVYFNLGTVSTGWETTQYANGTVKYVG